MKITKEMASVGIKVEIVGGKYQGKDGIIHSVSSTRRSVRVSLNKSLKSLTGYIPIHHIMILENIGPSGEVTNTSSAKLVNQTKNHQSIVQVLEPDIDMICNVIGSSKDKPRGASSWKRFWEISTGENWPEQCAICPKAKRIIGGHVYVKGQSNVKIVPICTSCNNKRSIDHNDFSPEKTVWTTIIKSVKAVEIL